MPQKVFGGNCCSKWARSSNDGREKEGSGCGVNLFMDRKSAMKHAFSVDFGLKKAVSVSGTGTGVGTRKESLWSARNRLLVSNDKGLWKCGGLKVRMALLSVGGTYLSQIADGMWKEPRLPSPLLVMSSVTFS